jgi:hypothetical protein
LRKLNKVSEWTGKQAIILALLCLSVAASNTFATTAEAEAAAGFTLIAPGKSRPQHFEGWNRLRNAGARGNVEALHWSAVHDFETCKARYSAPGTYRKTCADYYSTLVSAASRFCARGTEQDLRHSLPYRVALEEQSRGQEVTAKVWHLINLRFCAKQKEHYPDDISTGFSAVASQNEPAIKALTESELKDAKAAVQAAEAEIKALGISPEG